MSHAQAALISRDCCSTRIILPENTGLQKYYFFVLLKEEIFDEKSRRGRQFRAPRSQDHCTQARRQKHASKHDPWQFDRAGIDEASGCPIPKRLSVANVNFDQHHDLRAENLKMRPRGENKQDGNAKLAFTPGFVWPDKD
jgi:hypothetical protein